MRRYLMPMVWVILIVVLAVVVWNLAYGAGVFVGSN